MWCFLYSRLFSPEISSMASSIPSSVYSLGKFSGCSAEFLKCLKCHHLCNFSDCITHTGYSKTCSNFIKFLNHPHSRHRAECGQLLLKTVTFSSSRQILHPFKIFPFMTFSSLLQQLLLCPGFAESCQHWKLQTKSDQLRDI